MRTQINLVDTGQEITVSGVTLRTQCKPDIEQLEKMLPPDKSALFRAGWEGTNVVFERVPEPQPVQVVNVNSPVPLPEDPVIAIKARVNALSQAKLKTRAVELAAPIPEGASMPTMREIVVKAELEALAKAAKDD